MTRKVAGTPVDPTLPRTPITINGRDYDLCFDLGALASAESALISAGHEVNLLAALPTPNLSNVRIIFACAIRAFHPDIDFNEAVGMVTLTNVYSIANAIAQAWQAALPEALPEPEGNVQAAE